MHFLSSHLMIYKIFSLTQPNTINTRRNYSNFVGPWDLAIKYYIIMGSCLQLLFLYLWFIININIKLIKIIFKRL